MPLALADIRINLAAEQDGAWIGSIPDMGDLELLVRGWHCPAAQELLVKLARQGLDHREAESRVLLEVILMGWRGLTDQGVPVSFSPATAEEMIIAPEYRLFRAAVRWAAEHVGMSAHMRGAA